MASTSEQVQSTSQAASARVQEMVAIVREYATKYSEAAPQGDLLNEIKVDLTAAADKLAEKKAEDAETVQTDSLESKARTQASAALLLVATAVDKASSFDKEYEVTKGLAQALHGAYARALGLLAQIQLHGKTVEGTLEASKARLSSSSTALTEALASIQNTPALSATAALLEQARDEVKASLAELEQAPLTEKPVVGGLQALALARKALAGANNVLASAADSLTNSAQVAAVVHSATDTVNTARTQLFALLDRVTARATSLLADVESYSVNAAVAVDQRFGLLDKAAALDAQFGVSTLASEGVRQTVGKAQQLNEQYGVMQRAAAAVEQLQGLDAKVTGGRVSPLVQSGIDMAVQGANSTLEYASGMQQRFVAAREGQVLPAGEQGHAVVERKQAQ